MTTDDFEDLTDELSDALTVSRLLAAADVVAMAPADVNAAAHALTRRLEHAQSQAEALRLAG